MARKYHHVEAARQRWKACDEYCADYHAATEKYCDYGPRTGKSYMSVKKKCDYHVNREVKCKRECLRRRGGQGRRYKA